MQTSNALALVLADIVVVALTIAALAALAGAMWLVVLIVLSTARRLRPAPRKATRIVAELGPDGRDSGRTRIEDRYTEIAVKPDRPDGR